ncbi:sarcosine oxidase subunit delta [Trinickia violacea]|uniref:Sarcosine oxidase subunit delta n=1 Tax=Trinickia violacea TaxID=2571746 RepID=A0A4P8J118_9BURK|nr:sarcosine oxidase subunit delta [Trinickia violacea]QCP53344.1 sarcosine oxidase subunit delta [Trinickia violacea]
MLLIECPWCGPRAESEFSCGGEADIARPLDTDKLTDREWGDYLFMRKNPRGVHREQWLHTQGCRRWFMATRDTVSYEIQGYQRFPTQAEAAAKIVAGQVGNAAQEGKQK